MTTHATSLDAAIEAGDNSLYNEDLAPVTQDGRTWSMLNYLTLWVGMSSQIPTYLVASGLIILGMNWWQAIFTVALGNVLILVPILLNSHVGAKYGIPFPVFARASYGTYGANLPAILRGLVATGWFGIQTWIGGVAVNLGIAAVFPGWTTFGGRIGGQPLGMWLSFLLFWALHMFIIYKGMDALRRLQTWAAPIVLAFGVGLAIWIIVRAHGIGSMLSDPGRLNSFGTFMPVFIPSLVGVMALWATLSLNVPDFTRFARNQRAQLIGQAIALPTGMTVFAVLGVILASGSKVVFGEAIWDPVQLAGHIGVPAAELVALLGAAVATLTVNMSANVVSPSYDFANVWPSRISRRTGGLIVGILGILCQPWRLVSDPSGFIFGWLGGYGAGMGVIAGVMIVDYWIVRRGQLRVRDLFSHQGVYRYQGGWNMHALFATVVGLFFAWGGYAIPPMHALTDYGWFVGFFVGGLVYWATMAASRQRSSATGERPEEQLAAPSPSEVAP
ncbi:NCS1 family nucleobase:cation symporter-1 [Dactylosporangium salmoneum]|uniref:NCS1 family nucleobase:cation symporter-1 n=1 Tax=Dactylosporangium salmoneum TaxID=53361 RepID=A0ABP5TR70_9ACTN